MRGVARFVGFGLLAALLGACGNHSEPSAISHTATAIRYTVMPYDRGPRLNGTLLMLRPTATLSSYESLQGTFELLAAATRDGTSRFRMVSVNLANTYSHEQGATPVSIIGSGDLGTIEVAPDGTLNASLHLPVTVAGFETETYELNGPLFYPAEYAMDGDRLVIDSLRLFTPDAARNNPLSGDHIGRLDIVASPD